jgi:hypothetical protein
MMFFKTFAGRSGMYQLRLLPLAAIMLCPTASVAAPVRSSASLPLLPLILISDEPKPEAETIVFALMSGKCPTLKVAGRDFACRAVAFFQTEEGRANFAIALDDPEDDSHIITFSGDRGVRPQDDLYELPIDEMQLKSKDRPKVDGLPVPLIEGSTGICRLVGSLSSQQVSNISCTAVEKNGKKFELRFDSDGSPMTLRRIRRTRIGGPPVMSPFD